MRGFEPLNILRVRLVNCKCNYIRIGIGIIRNIRCCDLILITIHLFGNNTILKPKNNKIKKILN